DRERTEPQRVPDAAAPLARGVGGRRQRGHPPTAPEYHPAARLHRGRIQHPLAREAGRLEEVTGMLEITPDLLLQAYRIGVFPMGERRDDPQLYWVHPRAYS